MAAACSAEQQIRQRVSHGDTIAGEDEAIDGTTNVAIPSSGGWREADKEQRWEEVWDVATEAAIGRALGFWQDRLCYHREVVKQNLSAVLAQLRRLLVWNRRCPVGWT